MNHEEAYQDIEKFLRRKLDETGAEGYVLGLSGGLDSAAAAKAAVKALGPEKLTCWIMPGKPSKEENMSDARELADELGVETHEVSIESTVERFVEETPFSVSTKTKGNIRARTRMVYEYIESNEKDKLVLGADNKSEILLGYFTKYGDGAVDVAPFAELYKTELKQFARKIGLGEEFLKKKPTAGLWEGQTDESELGDPYEVIDPILKAVVEEDMSVEEAARKTGNASEKVRHYSSKVDQNIHKRTRPERPDLR